jgi:hypothetical protein
VFLLHFILLITARGLSQTNEIRINFISNCRLHMTDGINAIYAYFHDQLRAFIYNKLNPPELNSLKKASFLFYPQIWKSVFYGKYKTYLRHYNVKNTTTNLRSNLLLTDYMEMSVEMQIFKHVEISKAFDTLGCLMYIIYQLAAANILNPLPYGLS